jgi:hypothetical protein
MVMNTTAILPLALWCFALPVFGQQPTAPTSSGIYSESRAESAILPVTPAAEGGAVPAVAPEPLTVRQKLLRNTKLIFGPVGLVSDGAAAAVAQWTNTPGPWGQGGDAYAERYASAFGISFVDEYSEFAIAAAIHEDPRYYPSADTSFGARLKSALKQTVIKRKDSGGPTFAYAEFGGALAGGFASTAWLPWTDNSIGDGFETAGLVMARDLGFNLVREFIPMFRRFR